jgi:hypothetical protein
MFNAIGDFAPNRSFGDKRQILRVRDAKVVDQGSAARSLSAKPTSGAMTVRSL